MNKTLTVSMWKLKSAKNDADYLQIILHKYNEVWQAAPDKLMELFSEEQISFLIYGILYDQVYNGGFLQLLFNGYVNYVFNSPLTESLRSWGAARTAELLESITEQCLAVSSTIVGEEKSLELLSECYSKYPEFKSYDKRFYENDGTKEIKAYIAAHLSEFITSP